MGTLRDRMETDCRLKGFRRATQDVYLRCVGRFAAHFGRSPAVLGEAEIRAFLDYLVREQKVAPSTHRVYVAALAFLYYRVTLERPEAVAKIPYPRVPVPLPDILSPTEIAQLLAATRSLKHRAILMTAYGAGLRVSEICALHVTDIDSERMLIHVGDGKGGNDRYVMLSAQLLTVLRAHWQRSRPPARGRSRPPFAPHIRNTPQRAVPCTTFECTAEREMPSTVRVSRGSMMPSSQTRAVAKKA